MREFYPKKPRRNPISVRIRQAFKSREISNAGIKSIPRRWSILRILLPVAVLAAGAAIAIWLMETGPQAKPLPRGRSTTLVAVKNVAYGPQKTLLSGMGTVVAARSMDLKPQVNGEIIEMNRNLVPGGHFRKGATLLKIDPTDYRLSVRHLTTNVAKAESDLQLEQGNQLVAQKEYKLLGGTVSDAEKALILRRPQLMNLRATLIGTDAYWVEVSVPVSQLRWIRIPRSGEEKGALVRIHDPAAWGHGTYREGRVIRLEADLEEQGRMARLLVRVEDPLSLELGNAGKPYMLINAYVRVEIEGKTVPSAAAVDREFIHNGKNVWVMGPQGDLAIRSVEIAFRGTDRVLITGGIAPGERLVVTDLTAPVEGMPLRTADVEIGQRSATPAPMGEDPS